MSSADRTVQQRSDRGPNRFSDEVPIVKGHGLGNDYLVINQTDLAAPLSGAAIQRICDRNFGAGSDGILLLVPSDRAAFGLRIFNPDGSEAEKSGNGLRIFAKYLWDHGHTSSETFTVDTKGGIVECRCHPHGEQMQLVTVEMGSASFRASQIPMDGPDIEAVGFTLELPDNVALTATALSVGNPHCVIFMDALNEGEIRRIGPLIEHHPLFPNRINVQFARPSRRHELDILIWERGAGYTLASGSSSCAAAAAAVRNGLCDHGRISVRMPGGELGIEVRPDWTLRLEGPVEEVYTGTLSAEFVRKYLD